MYRWVITRDIGWEKERGRDDFPSRVGTEGPRDCDQSIETNVPFRMWEEDYGPYDEEQSGFEGLIGGDFYGFEPVDDFGAWDTGCTNIELFENGRWVAV